MGAGLSSSSSNQTAQTVTADTGFGSVTYGNQASGGSNDGATSPGWMTWAVIGLGVVVVYLLVKK